MNLENISLKPIIENVCLAVKEAQREALSMDCAGLLKLIQTAKTIFKDNLKIKIGQCWFADILLTNIIRARDEYDSIQLSFETSEGLLDLVYSFDEEANCWLCIMRTAKKFPDLIIDLILTRKLASIIPFEMNMGSFKVVELANNLRKV